MEMDFHSIQTEKAKAMARYRLLGNLAKIWRLTEIVIALSLVSWSSTRISSAAKIAAQLVGKIATSFYAYALNPLINFVIFNTIILFLFLLSRQKPESGGGREENMDLVVFSESDFEINSPLVPPREAAAEESLAEKEEIEAVGVAIEEAKRQIRRFERTQSAYLKRDLQRGKPRHQMRRSVTDIKVRDSGDEMAISVIDKDEGAISVIERVDSLSSKEFQRTIDEFIARQQRFLLVQKMAEKQLVDIY